MTDKPRRYLHLNWLSGIPFLLLLPQCSEPGPGLGFWKGLSTNSLVSEDAKLPPWVLRWKAEAVHLGLLLRSPERGVFHPTQGCSCGSHRLGDVTFWHSRLRGKTHRFRVTECFSNSRKCFWYRTVFFFFEGPGRCPKLGLVNFVS